MFRTKQHTHTLFSHRETLTCTLFVYLPSDFLSQITNDTNNTKSVINIPGLWLLVEVTVDTLYEEECFTTSVSPPDVKAVEARRAALREAGGGLSSHRVSWTFVFCHTDGAQHIVALRGPAPGPGPAYLLDDASSAGCVWLLCLDCAHPHLSAGNAFFIAHGQIIVPLLFSLETVTMEVWQRRFLGKRQVGLCGV